MIPSLFGAYIPVTASKSYNDILPSLNFAYDVTKEVVVRFAAAKVMSRPDYTDMVPRVVLNTGALSRHGRQSQHRPVPGHPGRPVDRVVSEQGHRLHASPSTTRT